MKPTPILPGPGQESVWDYPRPPRVEATTRHLQVWFENELIAETRRAQRVLETSQAPAYYFPPADVAHAFLMPGMARSWCEWKGATDYFDIVVGRRRSPNAAWSFATPTAAFQAIGDHIAFYPQRVDACFVDGERVIANGGDFYGGWITSDIVGPFKGATGTTGW